MPHCPCYNRKTTKRKGIRASDVDYFSVVQPIDPVIRYYNNPNDPVRDLRAMVYQAVASVDPSLDHVQIDVLRLLPYVESAEYSIPPKIMSKQLSPRITMSVYNIPNGQDDLKHAMRHLAQLYYNINVLHISNIPMKVSESVSWLLIAH